MKCEGKTKKGEPCKNIALSGGDGLCRLHREGKVEQANPTITRNQRILAAIKGVDHESSFLNSLKDQLLAGRSLTQLQLDTAAKVMNAHRERETKQRSVQCVQITDKVRCVTIVTGTAKEIGAARNRCAEHNV